MPHTNNVADLCFFLLFGEFNTLKNSDTLEKALIVYQMQKKQTNIDIT